MLHLLPIQVKEQAEKKAKEGNGSGGVFYPEAPDIVYEKSVALIDLTTIEFASPDRGEYTEWPGTTLVSSSGNVYFVLMDFQDVVDLIAEAKSFVPVAGVTIRKINQDFVTVDEINSAILRVDG